MSRTKLKSTVARWKRRDEIALTRLLKGYVKRFSFLNRVKLLIGQPGKK